jgi:hypothetical protein
MEKDQIDPQKRLVWFFGPSAAGKKKLACNLATQENHPLKEPLGLTKQPQLCRESPKSSGRTDLLKIVPAQLQQKTCLLLKGQTEDFNNHVPETLRAALPQVHHLLVFLWATPETLLHRVHCRTGGTWGDCRLPDRIRELRGQVQETEKLRKAGFAVLCFDSSDETYTPLDWQEVLNKSTGT